MPFAADGTCFLKAAISACICVTILTRASVRLAPRSKPASLHCLRRASSSLLREVGTRIEMVPVGSDFCLRIFMVVTPLSNVGFVYNLQTFVNEAGLLVLLVR